MATRQLTAAIDGLPDTAARGASLLPGWTRGHVLSHLARNAEAGVRLLDWARTGVPSRQYESLGAREADIEAGAGRPVAELAQDVRQTAAAFADEAAAMPPQAWQRVVRYAAGEEPAAVAIAAARLAEVLVHHVDLDIGYRSSDWPAPFTGAALSRVTAFLRESGQAGEFAQLRGTDTGHTFDLRPVSSGPAGLVVAGPEHELLAWLLGRSGGRSLTGLAGPAGPVPAAPGLAGFSWVGR